MNIIATTRNVQGTGASRRLRRADKLPGIVYGGNLPATPIELEHNPIFYALRKEKFHASILTMELDGKEELVVLRAFQMHPYKPQVMHIDFQRINPNEKVTMRVPLHFQGEEESPAVKVSKCIVSHAVSAIEVTCMPKELPEFITVDLPSSKPARRSTPPCFSFRKASKSTPSPAKTSCSPRLPSRSRKKSPPLKAKPPKPRLPNKFLI